MSSIRMTHSLRATIMSKAHALYVQPKAKARNKLSVSFYDRLMTEIYESRFAIYHINKLPSKWLKTADGIVGYINGTITGEKFRYHIQNTLNTTRPILDINSLFSFNSSYGFKEYEPSKELFIEYHRFIYRVEKIDKEATDFVSSLKTVLTRCNTLKQFLDAWPQGEVLVSDDLIREFNTPPPKKQSIERISEDVSISLSTTLIKRTILNK